MSPRNNSDSSDDSRSFYRRRLLRNLLAGAAISGVGTLICIAAFTWNDARMRESSDWFDSLLFLLAGSALGLLGGGLSFSIARLKERKGNVWAGLSAIAIGIAIYLPLGFNLLIAMIDPQPDSCIFGKDQYCFAFDFVSPYGQVLLAGGFSLVWGLITLYRRSIRPKPIAPPG